MVLVAVTAAWRSRRQSGARTSGLSWARLITPGVAEHCDGELGAEIQEGGQSVSPAEAEAIRQITTALSTTSALLGNLCLGSLTYRNRLSSSVSVVPDLRHSHYRVHLPPR